MRRRLSTPRPAGRKLPIKASDISDHQGQVKARLSAEAGDRLLNELNPVLLGAELLERALDEASEEGSDLVVAMAASELDAAGEYMAHVLDEAVGTGEPGITNWL